MNVYGRFALAFLTCAILVGSHLTHAQKRIATGTVPPPQFADPQRKQKLAAAFPEIEKTFQKLHGAVTNAGRSAGSDHRRRTRLRKSRGRS